MHLLFANSNLIYYSNLLLTLYSVEIFVILILLSDIEIPIDTFRETSMETIESRIFFNRKNHKFHFYWVDSTLSNFFKFFSKQMFSCVSALWTRCFHSILLTRHNVLIAHHDQHFQFVVFILFAYALCSGTHQVLCDEQIY